MDRKDFYHLYVNLNSLVELGMQRRAERLLASLPESPALPELTPEEADARMMKSFENMDLSALDPVWENLRNTPLDLEQVARDAAAAAHGLAPAEVQSPAADGGLPDLDAYMQRAYTYEDELRERIDRLFAKADLDTMRRQLAELDGPQPTLTGQLTGPQMAQWLERDDAVLTDLASAMRRLEMAA